MHVFNAVDYIDNIHTHTLANFAMYNSEIQILRCLKMNVISLECLLCLSVFHLTDCEPNSPNRFIFLCARFIEIEF